MLGLDEEFREGMGSSLPHCWLLLASRPTHCGEAAWIRIGAVIDTAAELASRLFRLAGPRQRFGHCRIACTRSQRATTL